jgi:hypothetical protein
MVVARPPLAQVPWRGCIICGTPNRGLRTNPKQVEGVGKGLGDEVEADRLALEILSRVAGFYDVVLGHILTTPVKKGSPLAGG